MKDQPNWCLVTTLKCNFSLLPWQIAFYSQHWGISTYLIFCGIPSLKARSLTEDVIQSLATSTIIRRDSFIAGLGQVEIQEVKTRRATLWFVLYDGKWNMGEQEFHAMRVALHQWADQFLPITYTRTLVVDNDEFVHLSDVSIANTMPAIGFHFVDIVPSLNFPHGDLVFCLQPWYYRRQATTWYLKPQFRVYQSLVSWALQKSNRLVLHSGCKTFYFDREKLGHWKSWHHGTNNCFASCGCVRQDMILAQNSADHLRQTGLVYHLANPSKQHFLRERLMLYARIQTDPSKGKKADDSVSDVRSSSMLLERDWNTNIARTIFPTFTDNYLKAFIDPQAAAFADLSHNALYHLLDISYS